MNLPKKKRKWFISFGVVKAHGTAEMFELGTGEEKWGISADSARFIYQKSDEEFKGKKRG